MKARMLILTVFGSLMVLLAKGIEEPEALFEQCNSYYQAKEYQKAIQCYDSLVDSGYIAAELYYNLGNACYKTNNLPKAILYYERAKKLSGQNPDLEHNLELAYQQIPDEVNQENRLFISVWWENLLYYFSATGWAAVSVLLIWGAFIGFVLWLVVPFRWLKKLGLVLGFVGVLLFIPALFLTIERYEVLHESNEAIVWDPNVYVKSAPDQESKDRFIIHEGLKIKLIDEVGEWRQIRLSDGKQGWVKEEVFRKI